MNQSDKLIGVVSTKDPLAFQAVQAMQPISAPQVFDPTTGDIRGVDDSDFADYDYRAALEEDRTRD